MYTGNRCRSPLLLTALLAGCMLLLPLLATAQQDSVRAEVRSTTGRVEFRQGGGSWQTLSEGDELPLGATISTGFNSSAVLEMGLAVLEVQALTRMTIEELAEREGVVESDLYLEVGRVRADVRRVEDRRQDFRLRSPVATAAVRGTSFTFDGRNLQVVEGIVELANLRGRRSVVPAGRRSRTVAGEAPQTPQQAAQEDTRVEYDTTIRVTGLDDDPVRDDDQDTIFDDDLPAVTGEFGSLLILFE
ncbi:FecR family protein [Spirochaeta africana]|uniref:FecR protein domain-containing protein n=1 Tax=Spirochaeta africana (strain ATCC 700263 / DSM 8902 / Z-7692) TaxID=889378 RepID=H9UFM5_SPIAZ|nr:FecR domain-containing protein [Spirochaeta africana]AFG36318.1 hypothetical protein Spiaf_0209 [Spirochaeta africana DSM 8902]